MVESLRDKVIYRSLFFGNQEVKIVFFPHKVKFTQQEQKISKDICKRWSVTMSPTFRGHSNHAKLWQMKKVQYRKL